MVLQGSFKMCSCAHSKESRFTAHDYELFQYAAIGLLLLLRFKSTKVHVAVDCLVGLTITGSKVRMLTTNFFMLITIFS